MTILVDLTPLVDGHGPARLLDMRPGRSADVLSGWLKERDPSFQEQIQVVTMDGFTGYTTAVEEQLPQANKVIDPFPCSASSSRQTHQLPTKTPTRDHRVSRTQR
ncbi:Transposase [Corynebacterium diphtheriae]|nr:Transposase [Corynebacterium diphtheriae] [Corynebacterium diphtheriae subsp. lausannense]